MRYLFIILTLILATPVVAQSEFNVTPEREGSGDNRTLAEIDQMKEVLSDLTDLESEIAHVTPITDPDEELVKPAYLTLETCSDEDYKIKWDKGASAWTCIKETDEVKYKLYARTDLPNCGAGQALTSTNGSSFSCVTIPIGEKGEKPAHQWSGTSVRFQTPSGSWGSYSNLRGPKGTNATCP